MSVEYWVKRAEKEFPSLGLNEMRAAGILPDNGNKFFPVIGYPPLTMFTDMDEGPLFDNIQQRPVYPTVGYLHIPFCPTRCTFCHWITKTKSMDEEVDVYLDYLDREMQLYKSKMGVDKIPVQSVLWGGGTPTYPKARQLQRLMESFTRHFDLSGCTQFSVEAEPTTLLGDEGRERLKVLKDYGVDRISLGVQSFDDDVLKYMARSHDSTEAFESIEAIRQADIPVVFIDLIYGYPGQTPEIWAANMLKAVESDIDGYQLYRLRIKQHGDRPGGIIKHYNNHPERFAASDEILLMKYLGIMISEEHGFHEYQTRVFSRKEDHISHYLRDWCCGLTDVVGVGVSSWSNLRGVFTQNVGDQGLSRYYDLIDQGKVSVDRGKVRTEDDEARRSFILPLKNMKVNKQAYFDRLGKSVHEYFGKEIAFFKQWNLIDEDDSAIWLTKAGRFFADEVCTQFFNPDYMPFKEVKKISDMVAAGSL